MTSAPVQINECPTLNIAHHTHDYRKYFLLITLDDILHVGYNMIHIIILSSVCYVFYSTENIFKYRGVSIFESTCQIYVLIELRRRWCPMFHVRPPIHSDRLWCFRQFSCIKLIIQNHVPCDLSDQCFYDLLEIRPPTKRHITLLIITPAHMIIRL